MSNLRTFKRARPAVALAAMMLVATGCGSRLTHDHLVAEWRGPAQPVSASVETAAQLPPAAAGATQSPQQPASEANSSVLSGGTGGGGAVASGTARANPSPHSTAPTPSGRAGAGSEATSATSSAGANVPTSPSRGSTPTAQTGAPAAPAPCSGSRAAIPIGTVGQQSGVLGSIYIAGVKTVQAWSASVNAAGGLKCHPVRYLIEDDGGDPSRHQALVRKLVEQEHVVGFVFMDAPLTGNASQSYITEKQIPVIGTELGSDFFYTSPMYFPQATGGNPIVIAIIAQAADVAKAAGKTKLGNLTCLEAPVCARMYEMANRASEFGTTNVYRAQASLAQPDYTSQCQAAQSAGVEVLVVTLDVNSVKRLLRSCNTVNFHPTLAVTATAIPAADPALDGVTLQHSVYPWFLTGNPVVAEYQNVLRRFSPAMKPSPTGMSGWVAAKLFELAARNFAEPPTSQQLLDGLWTVKDNDMGGVTQPLTFTRGQNAPRVVCYWGMTIKGSEFISNDGGKRTCLQTDAR